MRRTSMARRSRILRLALVGLLVAFFLALLLPGLSTRADSPTPSAPASSAAPSASASPTPVGQTPYESNYEPPCPNPTPTAPPAGSPGLSPTPSPTLAPGASHPATPVPSPTRHPNLCPAQLGASPIDLLAVLFTPIFQAIFLGLAVVYNLTGDIGIAIIIVTLLIRLVLVPIFRRQIVSTRRLQALQPELAEIRRRYKGDRNRQSQEQMKLYQERGVNPAAGCLPSVLTLFLLAPMYYVFSGGLQAPDISSMLHVFGIKLLDVACQDPTRNALVPCINPTIHWLAGLDAAHPAVLFELKLPIPLLGTFAFGVSVLAIASALLQLIQSRMMMPPATDPQSRSQQQIFLIVPLISIFYGSILPAGLFLYWIVTTVFSIVQQYLTVGWGSLFPLFGWMPAFARDHTPRFGVPAPPTPRPNTLTTPPAKTRDPQSAAAGTVRPSKSRARTSRRGRRR